MDSLVGYGSDDEVENYGNYQSSVGGDDSGAPRARRKDDDTNYDDVNMDMSEDSQGESEPELPPAEPQPRESHREDRRGSGESRDRDRDRRRHESPRRDRDRDRRDHRRDDKYRSERVERSERRDSGSGRRGLLGDRPDDTTHDANKVPALMDLKPFGGEVPPSFDQKKSQDARDAVSPRFTDRDRDRDRGATDRRDRERERERDREHRHSRRSEEKKSHKYSDRRDRSRSRGSGSGHGHSSGVGAAFPPPSTSTSSSSSTSDRPSPTDYRPSSYKVNKKLEVMEKMGLQIKTPDGHMATAQQLRAARGHEATSASGQPLPSYYNPTAVNSNKILDQVQKRKLLWSGKNKNETEEAAKWSGTRFAQDNDGKQVSKFMRLMGIKEPAAVKPESTEKTADPIKKQEELFQAMQAQYEVARATTHTMRGVGLGFSRQY